MLGEVRRILPGAPELSLENPTLPLYYKVKPALDGAFGSPKKALRTLTTSMSPWLIYPLNGVDLIDEGCVGLSSMLGGQRGLEDASWLTKTNQQT